MNIYSRYVISAYRDKLAHRAEFNEPIPVHYLLIFTLFTGLQAEKYFVLPTVL